MPTDEVEANLRHFTTAGTRSAACTSLVLSGVGVAGREDLHALCASARSRGVQRITLHAGVEDLERIVPNALPVDVLVLPLQPGESGATLAAGARALANAREAGIAVAANASLTPENVRSLAAIGRVAVAGRASSITFTFPFPVDGAHASDVVPAPRAVAALREVVPAVARAGIQVTIKGLPACYLGELAAHTSRTANRWYVDADHQLDRALLFFPDVVAFHKDEACRFCPSNEACDGFFANYLRRPGFPPLRPVGG